MLPAAKLKTINGLKKAYPDEAEWVLRYLAVSRRDPKRAYEKYRQDLRELKEQFPDEGIGQLRQSALAYEAPLKGTKNRKRILNA